MIKAFARTPDHDVDALLDVARRIVPPEQATVTQAGLGFIEICPPGVDKATGLAVVAQALGVDPADVLVFGDMPNDLPMFEWAGWAPGRRLQRPPVGPVDRRRDHPAQRRRRGGGLPRPATVPLMDQPPRLVATDLDGTLVRRTRR